MIAYAHGARARLARRAVGVVRLVAGIAVLATLVVQIADRVAHRAFDPAEYFSYFTIQSCLIIIVVLLVGGFLALGRERDSELYTTIRMSIVAYAIVTAGVYNLLLRSVPYEGYQGLQWPNEVLHVWVPMIIVLDWIISPGRPALRWRALPVVIVYPIAWIAFTLVRGAATGGYPYPFLEPRGPGGWGSVIAYIVGLALFILAIGAVALAYGRRFVESAPIASRPS